jgi:hypothetical protein
MQKHFVAIDIHGLRRSVKEGAETAVETVREFAFHESIYGFNAEEQVVAAGIVATIEAFSPTGRLLEREAFTALRASVERRKERHKATR